MNKVEITIIIVNYHTESLLEQCLTSLEGSDETQKFQVIIVDNGSSPGTLERLKERFGGQLDISIIFNRENVGFAKANNLAIPRCLGNYLLFLNPDTVSKPGLITTMIKYLNEHPDVGIVGQRILYEDGSLQLSCGRIPTLGGTICDSFNLYRLSPRIFSRNRYGKWNHSEPREVGWVSGACLLIRKDLFISLGGVIRTSFSLVRMWTCVIVRFKKDTELCTILMQKLFILKHKARAKLDL